MIDQNIFQKYKQQLLIKFLSNFSKKCKAPIVEKSQVHIFVAKKHLKSKIMFHR